MSSGTISAEPPVAGAPPKPGGQGWRRHGVALLFLAPAVFFLGLWIVYPAIRTFIRSFFDRSGDNFIWFDNYTRLFNDPTTVTAIKNNAIWVGFVPALVTAIGLIFAVMTERVSWSVAFKTAVFMPMAISLFAAGVIWRAAMYPQSPDLGFLNGLIAAVADEVKPPGVLSEAKPSTDEIVGTPAGGLTLDQPLAAGTPPSSALRESGARRSRRTLSRP